MTKVSVMKRSQNCTRTIRSGVFGIPKYFFWNACKACYFNIFGYAKNTTFYSPRSILRPLYKIYFCHITIKKWSQICTGTIRNVFLADILSLPETLGSFPLVILIVHLLVILDHEGVELSLRKFLWLISAPKKTIKKKHQSTCLDVFDKIWHALPL